jgi:hypothetical protein
MDGMPYKIVDKKDKKKRPLENERPLGFGLPVKGYCHPGF